MAVQPQWFEDLYVGHQIQAQGEAPVSKEEIIEFAEKYDPWYFHTNEAEAKKSLFGGLVASGIHTLALLNIIRLKAHGELQQVAGLGIDETRLSRPLRPGDTMSIVGECVDLADSPRKDAGIATYGYKALNQDSQELLRFRMAFMVARRPGD